MQDKQRQNRRQTDTQDDLVNELFDEFGDRDWILMLLRNIKKSIANINEEVMAIKKNLEASAPVTDDDKFMTIEQCSEYTTFSKHAIYNKVQRREIPYHKVGQRILFRKSELDEWITKDGIRG